ncbi:MAG: CDP-glycerol glycerophosphotransferase family protein [Lachnospiraceae bacterium]
MDKEKLKKIKVLYYPYIALKKVVNVSINYIHYISSLYYISRNKMRVQKKIDQKEVLNVVFVVQYIPSWNKLEPIYTKMKNEERFNPTIVCVPFNIQNHKLMDNNGNDTYEYFVKHGYEAINALKDEGSWYDLKQLNPDYVFHSRPYNYVMPKGYTSGKIVKYALICNVLYGLSLTKNVEPLLLNKDYFKDCFCYYALDVNEKSYYEKRFFLGVKFGIQKCFSYGGIGIEQILLAKVEKRQNEFKKTIIWTPRWSTDDKIGGSNFFNYRNIILKLVNSHKDCLFVFRPHPLMFSNFVSTGEMSEVEVKEFKQFCRETVNVVLDETKEYYDTFWQSDFLITDGSAIVPEYFSTGKPIMFCQSKISEANTDFYNDIISRCYEVYNEHGLVNYFEQLLAGNDVKSDARKELIDKTMNNYKNNSERIINSLIFWK